MMQHTDHSASVSEGIGCEFNDELKGLRIDHPSNIKGMSEEHGRLFDGGYDGSQRGFAHQHPRSPTAL